MIWLYTRKKTNHSCYGVGFIFWENKQSALSDQKVRSTQIHFKLLELKGALEAVWKAQVKGTVTLPTERWFVTEISIRIIFSAQMTAKIGPCQKA